MIRVTLFAIALTSLLACGDPEPATEPLPQDLTTSLTDQRETLVHLERQVTEVSETLRELSAMTARLEALGAQVANLDRQVQSQRVNFDENAARQPEPGRSGARGLFLFLLGGACAFGLLALRKVLFDQDTGDFPPEAHVPGVTTPPDQSETP